MTVCIGEKTLATRRPADLDATLIASTGCNAAEAQTWLSGTPFAGFVAAALLPFLTGDDAPSRAELATMIVEAGVSDVAPQVAALYVKAADVSSAVAEAPVPPAETAGDGA